MSDHLPECPALDETQPGTPVVADNCYCDRLRACEQRVRESAATLWDRTDEQMADSRRQGYAAGVQAARDAVADSAKCHDCMNEDALVAIDALKEKP